jgi:2-polyprenyl-3-methyl-5-hydroxy-6-metoxy-1,4-benzoquinol methylase
MNLKEQKIKEFSNLLDENSYYQCKCVVCGSSEFEQLATTDRYGFHYRPGICKTCGNVQQIEYYKPEILKMFYANYYSYIYRDGVTLDQTFAKQQRKGREILSYCAMVIPTQGSVLDIGCSCGGVLSIFKQKGYECSGCDYDKNYLEFGRSKGLRLYDGGIEGLPPAKLYDLIILRHVLEHIPDPIDFLSGIIPLLKPSGHIYIEVPSIENVVDGGYDFNFSAYFQNAHFIHFTAHSLKNLASLSGLQIIKSNRYIKSLVTTAPKLEQRNLNFADGYQYARLQMDLGNQRRNSLYRHYLDFIKRSKKTLKKTILRALVLIKKN